MGEEPDGGSPSEWIGEGGEGRAWIGFGGSVLVGRPGGAAGQGSKKRKEKTTKKGRKSEPGGRKWLQKAIKRGSGGPPGAEAEKEAKKMVKEGAHNPR